MNKEEQTPDLSTEKALSIADVRRSILRELRHAKKKHLMDKNTPNIESRKYAIAHGSLTATLKAIEIVKQYCA